MSLNPPEFRVMPLTLASVALLAVTILVAELSGVRLVCLAHASPWIGIAAVLTAWLHGSWRKLTFVPMLCELSLIYTNVTAAALIFSYVTLRPALPLADATLYAIDRSVGVSVPAIVAWVDSMPLLSWSLQKSYQSLGLQLGFIPVILALLQVSDRAARMLVAQALICFIGCTVSIGWPAVGSFSFLQITPADLHNLNGVIGYHFHEGFFAARSEPVFMLSTERISGVSTFPSIHAALAIACAWAVWPIRWLRYPGLVLNGLMFVSTIPVGAHYGVDLAAGTLLAMVTIWACCRLPAALWEPRLLWQRPVGPATAKEA